MTEILMTAFTGAIMITTVVYTVITIRLWRATKASVDVAKASVVLSYLTTLIHEAEKMDQADPQGAIVVQQFAMLLTEVAMTQFLEDANLNKQPSLLEAIKKFEAIFRAHGVNPESIPWYKPIAAKMKAAS